MRRILSGHLNNKGVTLITLIIAITIFAIFITVFSYVMVAKHGSSALYVQSTQAYAVAQAGIEYGIRYATDNDSDAINSLGEINFGDGSFTLVYDDSNNALTSTGTAGVAERAIILSSFSGYVGAAAAAEGIVLGGSVSRDRKVISVPLTNNYGENVDIANIKLAKSGTQATLRSIKFGTTTVWSGSQSVSTNPGSPTDFVFSQVYSMGSSVTLILTVSSQQGLSGTTGYCTFPDPESSLVTFTIP